jgi:hypothetical protein
MKTCVWNIMTQGNNNTTLSTVVFGADEVVVQVMHLKSGFVNDNQFMIRVTTKDEIFKLFNYDLLKASVGE